MTTAITNVDRTAEPPTERGWSPGRPGQGCRIDGDLHVHSFCVGDGSLTLAHDALGGTVIETHAGGSGGVLTHPGTSLVAGRERAITTAVHVVLYEPDPFPGLAPWISAEAGCR